MINVNSTKNIMLRVFHDQGNLKFCVFLMHNINLNTILKTKIWPQIIANFNIMTVYIKTI